MPSEVIWQVYQDGPILTATGSTVPTGPLTLPANYFQVGKSYRLTAWGRIQALLNPKPKEHTMK